MRVIPLSLALLLWVALLDQPRAASPLVRAPARIILDTDMSGDCDDAGALALLHALADRGECELLATIVNRKDLTGASAAATDTVNTFYGRPGLPIGTDKRGPTALQRTSAFARALRDEFLNDIGPDDRAPDALDVYREVLAAQPDRSVVICSVGALSNLAELWRQAPELVRQKVRQLVVMGGQFPKSEQPETNIATHREAAQLVAAEWPGDIVWHGWEVGNALFTGAALKQVPEKNPVRRAYELKPFGKRPAIEGGQPSWDQAAALFAVRGPQPALWEVIAGGRVRVDDRGNTTWEADPKGPHSYVKIRGETKKLADMIENLMIQPPKPGTASAAPLRIFFDTDIHNDCDDAGALAVLHPTGTSPRTGAKSWSNQEASV
jgi:inosine-uridine nucleoside N-ribohydrolase